jgi:hypothetical protein
MGEARKEALRVGFDGSLKLEFHGAAITRDAGLVAYRELDETLGLTATADDVFCDPRRDKNTQSTEQEHTAQSDGLAAAIGVQSPGGLRGYERCGTACC